MTDRKLILPALAGVLGMSAIVSAAEPTAAELREQIEALQAKVEKIEAKEASMQEQAATLQNVLSDAQQRSQLLQTGRATAGFDGKEFFLASENGDFKLVPYFQFQFRSVTNYGEDTDGGDESTESGFEIRRMKFGLKGNAFSKALKYDFNWATNRSGGGLTLEKAFVQYAFADDWAFRVGQWKDNVFREETISSSRQLTVDRSLVNELLAGGQTDYVQGVSLLFDSNDLPFRGELALTDGANTDNTNYLDGEGGSDLDPNFGVSVRGEYKAFGDWKAYDDFSAMGTKEDLLVIGVGANYTEGGDSNIIYHTVDVQYELSGIPLGFYAAYIGQYSEIDADEDGYNWGGLVQAGYMLNKNWEVFGRFDYTDLDDADSYQEYTVGANYYFHGHNAKATVDLVILPDGAPGSDSGLGIQGGDDFQAVLRGQFQLAL